MGDRHDGDGWESCACIYGGTATVCTGQGSGGDEEFDGEGDISEVSAGEAGVMGRGVLGRRVLCSHGRERSDGGSDPGVHQEARARDAAQKLRAAQIILKETPPLGAGRFICSIAKNNEPS